jgi:hypothetical protein
MLTAVTVSPRAPLSGSPRSPFTPTKSLRPCGCRRVRACSEINCKIDFALSVEVEQHEVQGGGGGVQHSAGMRASNKELVASTRARARARRWSSTSQQEGSTQRSKRSPRFSIRICIAALCGGLNSMGCMAQLTILLCLDRPSRIWSIV